MNWEKVVVVDGEYAGEYWLRSGLGPFQIDILPPWPGEAPDAWAWCVSIWSDELFDGAAATGNEAKRKALGWLNAQFRNWNEELDNEMVRLLKEERDDDH